jgi:hypothetical protein
MLQIVRCQPALRTPESIITADIFRQTVAAIEENEIYARQILADVGGWLHL